MWGLFYNLFSYVSLQFVDGSFNSFYNFEATDWTSFKEKYADKRTNKDVQKERKYIF